MLDLKIFKKISFLIFLVAFTSCKWNSNEFEKKPNIISSTTYSIIQKKNNKLINNELDEWLFKDIIDDTIPGTSLNKAYELLEKKTIKDTIIVAVLDSPIDINHEDLSNQIWINTDEIPNNGIDDDNNGYIDDINGWNFLGNSEGLQNRFTLYETTRILKKYKNKFADMNQQKVSHLDTSAYQLYSKASLIYEEQRKKAIEDTSYANMLISVTQKSRKILGEKFPNLEFSISSLDSLKITIDNSKDSIVLGEITKLGNFLRYGFTEDYLSDYKLRADSRLSKLLNLNYNERSIQGDDDQDINDHIYGNGVLNNNIKVSQHGTIVSGVIGAVRNNNKGINGIGIAVKIMPIVVSGFGDENDKDIALAIKYAVDNGAKVINMSFGKNVSLHKKWIDEALNYADKNNVLIVSSAGNESKKLESLMEFPTDGLADGSEGSSNFIHVGASTHMLENKLVANFSNYSDKEVDLFAPGRRIKSLIPNNQYKTDSGTSLASAVVSGIASLIWSYFPDIKASQMKEILLRSGNAYHLNTQIKSEDKKSKILVPFSNLSKSGKIVNAYNAVLFAEKISKFN